LADACERAIAEPESDHLLVLDEFNRANVPRVLGEFLLLLEGSRRAVRIGNEWSPRVDGVARLTYSGRRFFVPENLYLLATMNTSDESVATLDSALRRRFAFMRLEPLGLDELLDELPELEQGSAQVVEQVVRMWDAVNQKLLRVLVGPDAMLGHSYFFVLCETLRSHVMSTKEAASDFLRYSLLPQLIDVLTIHGREDLMQHEAPVGIPPEAAETIKLLQATLAEFGLALEVLGSGLGRRIVVVDSDATYRKRELVPLEIEGAAQSGSSGVS
jgi:hypothetical protein